MTLQTSGQIKLSDLETEFNKNTGTALNLSDFYGAASGVPTSGQLKIGDFYGKAGGPSPPVHVQTTSIFMANMYLTTVATLSLPANSTGAAVVVHFAIGYQTYPYNGVYAQFNDANNTPLTGTMTNNSLDTYDHQKGIFVGFIPPGAYNIQIYYDYPTSTSSQTYNSYSAVLQVFTNVSSFGTVYEALAINTSKAPGLVVPIQNAYSFLSVGFTSSYYSGSDPNTTYIAVSPTLSQPIYTASNDSRDTSLLVGYYPMSSTGNFTITNNPASDAGTLHSATTQAIELIP